MVDEELGVPVDKICRCCMGENENMYNLFENKSDIESSSSVLLSEMLIACASVEVLFGDGLPSNLCDSCKVKLLNAYEFRLQCRRSNSTLRVLSNAESKHNITKEENINYVQPDDVSEEEDERPLLERVLIQGRPKKNDNGFPCNFCHKVLRTNRGLQGHLRTHTGEKMSQCTDPLTLHSNDIKQEKEEEIKLEVVSTEEDSVDVAKFKEYVDSLIGDNLTNNFWLNKDEYAVSIQDISGQVMTKLGEQNSDVSTNSAISDWPLAEDNQDDTGGLPTANERACKKNKVCHVCGASFLRLDLLVRHMKLHHSVLMHQCYKCEKSFATKECLKKHLKKEHRNRTYVCTLCNKTFTSGAVFNKPPQTASDGRGGGRGQPELFHIIHMRRHTGDMPYKCDQCDKGFPRRYDLKCHERQHTGEKPYLCTLCGRSFKTNGKLTRHNRVHTGERPYKCSVCGKSFAQWDDLSLHKMRHSGTRPFGCNDCSARFYLSNLLKQHCKRSGHSMDERPRGFQGPHGVEPAVPIDEPKPVKFKVHHTSEEADENDRGPVASPKAEGVVEEAEERSLEGSSRAS
ncbi:hypothetical protein NQ318_020073 [Aromia moschata]|uniref:Uncharacterized protein n=1 Tax=Aromia moschata TaxID=1265417 RepID=A0AAV8Z9A2_9CUCU|nr:hypothetical protein NQ318_020073 [Aromia moschata]